MKKNSLNIAMLSIHSDPIGELGTKDTGGMSVYIKELAHELGRRGHGIDIYTRSMDNQDLSVKHLYENVRLIHVGIPNGNNLSKLTIFPFLPKYFRAIENFRISDNRTYDIIHSHYWLSGQLGIKAQKVWQCPHLTTFHTLGKVKDRTGAGAPEPQFRIAAEDEIILTCHRILAPTGRERDNLVRLYGATSDRIGIVPCGVNLRLFYPAAKSAAREKLEMGSSDTILLYIGRFDPLKGLGSLLEAMPHIKNGKPVRLVIVGGDGDRSSEYRAMVQKARHLNIDKQVTFAGQIDQRNLPPYYAAADVLVMPSSYESFGLVGLEALASGRPVVSPPVGAIDSLIQKAQAGCVVSDPSPRSLAAGIQSVISNRNVPPAEAIRESILEYSWPNVASAVIAEYKGSIQQLIFEDERQLSACTSC